MGLVRMDTGLPKFQCLLESSDVTVGNKYYLLVVFLEATDSLRSFSRKSLSGAQVHITAAACQLFFQVKTVPWKPG